MILLLFAFLGYNSERFNGLREKNATFFIINAIHGSLFISLVMENIEDLVVLIIFIACPLFVD